MYFCSFSEIFNWLCVYNLKGTSYCGIQIVFILLQQQTGFLNSLNRTRCLAGASLLCSSVCFEIILLSVTKCLPAEQNFEMLLYLIVQSQIVQCSNSNITQAEHQMTTISAQIQPKVNVICCKD